MNHRYIPAGKLPSLLAGDPTRASDPTREDVGATLGDGSAEVQSGSSAAASGCTTTSAL